MTLILTKLTLTVLFSVFSGANSRMYCIMKTPVSSKQKRLYHEPKF